MDKTISNQDYKDIDDNNKLIIEELQDYFKNHDTITIIGKGDTAQYKTDIDTIGINQALIFTNYKFLFINDFESLFGIENLIKEIKYLFLPDFPHCKMAALKNFTYKDVYKYINKYKFAGKCVVYQLHTTHNKQTQFGNIPFIPSAATTHTATEFFSKVLNKKNFTFYGINKTKLYHPDLKNLDFSHIKNNQEYRHLFDAVITRFNNNFDPKLNRTYHHANFGSCCITFN